MLSKSLSPSAKRARLHDVLGPPCPQCGGSLAELAQAIYPLLVAHADDHGREAGDVFTVRHQIDPSSPRGLDDFERALRALGDVGLILRYESGRHVALQIVDFDEHQTGLHKRTTSKFPNPPDDSGKFPEVPGVPGNSGRFPPNRTEQNLTKERKNALRAEPQPVEKSPPVEKSRREPPKVKTLAAMILKDVLPLGLSDEGDVIETAKRQAKYLDLTYTSAAICRALDSARAQLAKRGPKGLEP